MILNIPRSHNVATQTVRLEKNPKAKPTDIPTTVVAVDATRKLWLEWKPIRFPSRR